MVGDVLCELGVKSVDALDDEYAVGGELYFLAVPLALTCDEVVLWKFYSFALQQSGDVVLKQMIVYGLDVVEVVVAVGQLRCVEAVDEVVVGGEGVGAYSACEELYAEAAAEGGLA